MLPEICRSGKKQRSHRRCRPTPTKARVPLADTRTVSRHLKRQDGLARETHNPVGNVYTEDVRRRRLTPTTTIEDREVGRTGLRVACSPSARRALLQRVMWLFRREAQASRAEELAAVEECSESECVQEDEPSSSSSTQRKRRQTGRSRTATLRAMESAAQRGHSIGVGLNAEEGIAQKSPTWAQMQGRHHKPCTERLLSSKSMK